MLSRTLLLAAGIAALPLAASAAPPVRGIYLGAGVGLNVMQDQSITRLPGTPARGHLEYQVGPAVIVSLGYGFGNGLRAELEGNFRHNAVNGANGFGPGSNAGGYEQKFGFMANLLYDFNHVSPKVQPYLGVGIGYAWADEHGVKGSAAGGAFRIANDGTTGSFAYQFIAGAAFPVHRFPGLAITAEYRFMGMPEDRGYDATTTSIAGPGAGHASITDNYNHSIMIGLRYNFGQTPPPPPPAPAPAPAPAMVPVRTYLVFFDWDRADLTARARQVIATAATNATRVQTTRIEVNGYTDSSGSRRYNQALSIRRANAVAAELVAHGIARTAIAIMGYGQSHPLVPTADGVREPQNRRVEIILK